MRYVLAILIALTSLTGCFNEESYDTDLIVRPEEQLESGGDFTPLYDVVAYAFSAETEEYTIQSYDDALAGIATNITTGASLSPMVEAISYPSIEGALSMNIQQELIILLVVDTQNGWYAYADFEVAQNMSTTYVSVGFRPWKDSDFTQGDWTFVAPETIIEDE